VQLMKTAWKLDWESSSRFLFTFLI
jgi:hypothetical protein